MALRISTGLRNFLLSGGSLKQAMGGGRIEVYSGTQPANADSATAGTLLVTITESSGAWTAETPATGSIELTAGAAGSITNVTVASVSILDSTVPFNTSLSQTATDLAAALNTSATNLDWTATASTQTVTLTAKPGLGTRYNALTLATTLTTMTKTDTNPSGGAYSVNGINFEDSGSGTMTKRSTETWTGVAAITGTAGWFRHYGPGADDGTADGSAAKLRIDGAIATSGQQLNMSPTSITAASTQTITTYSPTVPASA